MILEDITHIECSICANPGGNHSSEAYFIFTMMLVMKWTMAGERGGGWGGIKRVGGGEQPEGFASEGQECFLMPLDYFSAGSEFPSGAVPPVASPARSKLIVLWPASLPAPSHSQQVWPLSVTLARSADTTQGCPPHRQLD